MMHTHKTLTDFGFIKIDGVDVWWRYSHPVNIVIHEKTETFAAPDHFGSDRMCLHDLKVKLKHKFRAAAVAEARAAHVAKMDEDRRKEIVGVKPMAVEDLVR